MIRRNRWPFALAAGFASIALGAWAISTPVNDWKIAGPFGGTATSIALDPEHPNLILAGGRNSLLFQSQDSGATWQLTNLPKRHFGEVTSIVVDPADSKHYLVGMIAADNTGVFESYDCGAKWTQAKDVQFGVRALVASPSKPSRFVAGTVGGGVMLSDDSGKSWTRISDPQNMEMQAITALAIDPKNPDIIYAGTAHLPWKTMDGGKTWESIRNGMIDDSDVFSIYIDPFVPSNVFASACSGIYATNTRGDVWRKLMGIPNTSRRTHVIREDPTQPGVLYAGTTLGFFKSVSGGTSWKVLSDSQVNAMVFDPSQPRNMYLGMEYEGVGKSSDGGQTITKINNGFVDRDIRAVSSTGNKLFAIESQEGDTTAVFVSENRGEIWSRLETRGLKGVHLHAITAAKSNDRILLAGSGRQMYKSVDSGSTWKPIPIRLILQPAPETSKTAKPSSARPVQRSKSGKAKASRPVKPRVLFKEVSPAEIISLYSTKNGTQDLIFATTDLGLLKSNDLGEHWTLADLTESTGSTAVYALFMPPAPDGRLIVRTGGDLYQSKDFGDHWIRLFFPLPTSDINDLAIPADPSDPLLVAARTGLYKSPDNGATWYPDTDGLPASTFSSVIYSCAETPVAYAVAYGQLYESTNAAKSWSPVSTALPGSHIRQLWIPDYSSKRVYGITSDLGILFRN